MCYIALKFRGSTLKALTALSDTDLLSETKSLVARERELLADILRHLREVECRRLFSDLGFKSLFEYATRELGYSEDQAYRRINAMRMVKSLPALEQKIEEGSLSLAALSVANSLFRAEAKHSQPLSTAKKTEVLEALKHTSRREAEAVAQKFSTLPPQLRKPETVRRLTDGAELRISVSHELQSKIEKVKGLLAHSRPNLSTSDLLEELCNRFLEDQKRKIESSARQRTGPRGLSKEATALAENAASKGRAIRLHIKRQVWARDKGRCRKCQSIHALEIDHIQPVALGGGNELDNLRLLCRSCNQREAIKALGVNKMGHYLEK